MKILIDCGAHKGKAIPILHQKFGLFDKHYLFECNPNLFQKLKKKFKNEADFSIYDSAIWVEKTTLPFYLGKNSISSSLISDKKNLSNTTIQVSTVDFSDWLKTIYKPKDEIYIKMDIEGAEYSVIEHLIATGTISLIKVLCCEWHAGRRLPPKEQSRERHRLLLERLRTLSLTLIDWT